MRERLGKEELENVKCCATNSKKISHTCIMERDVCLCWQLLQFHLTSDILSKKENSEMEKLLGIELNGKMMMMFTTIDFVQLKRSRVRIYE